MATKPFFYGRNPKLSFKSPYKHTATKPEDGRIIKINKFKSPYKHTATKPDYKDMAVNFLFKSPYKHTATKPKRFINLYLLSNKNIFTIKKIIK